MILAAGLGTRLKPFTDQHPKALAIVNGKTILQRNIEYLSSFGIKEVIINLHHFPEQIVDFIKVNHGFNSEIYFSDESDEVLETGGGLKKAAWFFEESLQPFVLMNVDILTDLDLNEMLLQHRKSDCLATLAVTSRVTSRYFLFDKMNQLCGWQNIKTAEKKISRIAEVYDKKAFSGIHIISPKIFSLIKLVGKFSMVAVYLELAKSHIIQGFDHTGSKFIDVGTAESILKAEEIFI